MAEGNEDDSQGLFDDVERAAETPEERSAEAADGVHAAGEARVVQRVQHDVAAVTVCYDGQLPAVGIVEYARQHAAEPRARELSR